MSIASAVAAQHRVGTRNDAGFGYTIPIQPVITETRPAQTADTSWAGGERAALPLKMLREGDLNVTRRSSQEIQAVPYSLPISPAIFFSVERRAADTKSSRIDSSFRSGIRVPPALRAALLPAPRRLEAPQRARPRPLRLCFTLHSSPRRPLPRNHGTSQEPSCFLASPFFLFARAGLVSPLTNAHVLSSRLS